MNLLWNGKVPWIFQVLDGTINASKESLFEWIQLNKIDNSQNNDSIVDKAKLVRNN